jgi:hypothetical protein
MKLQVVSPVIDVRVIGTGSALSLTFVISFFPFADKQ